LIYYFSPFRHATPLLMMAAIFSLIISPFFAAPLADIDTTFLLAFISLMPLMPKLPYFSLIRATRRCYHFRCFTPMPPFIDFAAFFDAHARVMPRRLRAVIVLLYERAIFFAGAIVFHAEYFFACFLRHPAIERQICQAFDTPTFLPPRAR
jgi:hypothetical protein